jgi:hypothetical protein
MGAPGASPLGTWESTDLGRPVLLLLDICSDSLYVCLAKTISGRNEDRICELDGRWPAHRSRIHVQGTGGCDPFIVALSR